MCAEKGRVERAVGHRRGTHLKHAAHDSDAGRVETQRLVECFRPLRRVETESHIGKRAACGLRKEVLG